ncbi:MAG: hypothetical protein C4344_02160 [Acidimicrobiia bacterium]
MTVIEVTLAAAILVVALTSFFAALASGMRTSKYGADRNRAYDDLRTAVAVFSKDARQGVAVTDATTTRVSLRTYVAGNLTTVTWRTVPDGSGQYNLARSEGTAGARVFVVNVTDDDVFGYFGEVDPARIHRVRISLATRPDPRYPEVVLSADLEMRNAT